MNRLPAALLAALLAVVGCVNVTPSPTPIGQPTGQPTGTPSPTVPVTPTSGPSATPGATGGPTIAPGTTIDPTLAAQIDAVTAGVPTVRGLEPTSDVPYEFIDRDRFRDELLELVDEDVPLEVRQAEERLYKRLGLLPADADLEALIVELYGAQVAAYYRPDNGRFYIIDRDQPFGAMDKVIVAHEYTHALQDQHFDLEANQITDPFEGDAALGQLAVIEGDASLTSQLWALANLTSAEQGELLMGALGGLGQDQLADMPLVLRRQLEFPYGEGLFFLSNPFANDGIYDAGGFAAVNEALENPPRSTEQILHPEKYSAREAPVEVEIRTVTMRDWDLVYQQTLGELGIQILATGGEEPPLNIPGLPVEWPHSEVAAGWSGDRLHMWENANGGWAIAWQTAWDTEADQAEFEARINELAGTFRGSSSVRDGQVIIASDESVLGQFVGGVFPPE